MLNNNDYRSIFHEIKNSIALISSSLQLVEKKHPEITAFEYWNETMSELSFLREMVVGLSYTRPVNRENFKPVHLHTLLEQIASSAAAITSDDFRYEVHFSGTDTPIEMDAMLMRQAVLNLLKNAYEAMQGSGLIHVDVTFADTTASISVTDKGGGIDPAVANTLFDTCTTTKSGGSGLGLSITKQIVEAHQGTLSYQSRPGDGCTFTIQLPFRQS